jgi:tetratricopeptide (TPR) repeat protein
MTCRGSTIARHGTAAAAERDTWLAATISSMGRRQEWIEGCARPALLAWVASLALLGCGAAPLPVETPGQRLTRLLTAVRAEGLALAEPQLLAPEVLAQAHDEIGVRGSVPDRLRHLSEWLSDRNGVAFRYDERLTLTATEAWQRRAGDCLSYAHLFNALAASLRIPMDYVRYRAPSAYQERGGQFVVISHVASLYDRDRETILVDLSGEELSPLRSDYQRLDVHEAMALHVSNLAMAELGRGQVERPERLLRLLLAGAPQLPDLHNNLGAVLVHRQRYAEALAVLQHAIARFPSYVPLYVNAALAARGLGKTQLADELTAKAQAPWTDPFIPFVRGARLVEEGQLAEGVAVLRDVVKLSPHSATFQAHLARGLLALGQRKEALAVFGRARELDPRHPMLFALARDLGVLEATGASGASGASGAPVKPATK